MNNWAMYLALLFGVLTLLLWIWAIYDMLTSRFFRPAQRLCWGLVLLLIPGLGMILYIAFAAHQKYHNRLRFRKRRVT